MQLLATSDVEHGTAFRWASGLLNAFAAGTLTNMGIEMIGHELDDLPAEQELPAVGAADLPNASDRDSGCADGCKGTGRRLYNGLMTPSAQAQLKPVAISVGATAMAVLAIWA